MDQVTDILTYHVVNGTVGYSSTLKNGTSLMTLEGGNITITINNGSVFVNDAKVIVSDVLVAGGVVHVIDKYSPTPTHYINLEILTHPVS
jgi:uncharacterized surface protein with fasciclin (FAS1) repeats